MSHQHFILHKPYGYLSQFIYELKRKKETVGELYAFPSGTIQLGRRFRRITFAHHGWYDE
jgi:23S rRNA pseudouridine2457 synthase